MRKPTAVIIGYGRMGREHERAYQECGVEVVGTYDEKANRLFAPGGFERRKPDYVSVCTHDDSHADYICVALEAGCKVIAEKPLCLTEADLVRIRKSGGSMTCNLPMLHLDWPNGRNASHISAEYDWGRADRIKEWRSKCPGYSFVLGAGVHLASMLLRLKVAPVEYVEAHGFKTSPDIDCETVIGATGSFYGGGTFSMLINCGSTGPHRHRFAVDDVLIEHRDTDKTAEPRLFIVAGTCCMVNATAAHSVCFAIERALKSGKRESVEYL